MSPRRVAALAALCGTVVLGGWAAAGLAGLGSPGIRNTGAPIGIGRASVPVEALQATTMGEDNVSVADVALVDADVVIVAADVVIVGTALPGSRPMLPPETPPLQVAVASTPDPVQNDAKAVVSAVETLDECLGTETCIDQYLWSVYQRTPKVDTVKVRERVKVTVKRHGKLRTVIKTLTKLVTEDFAWKDPKAAQRVGMPLMEYVIGGMDRSFKLKLYHCLRALDDADLSPGITSAFRDNYRQSIASGKKAATDSSYHGGSRRGGYGHGFAADLVSVRGETRAERWASTEILWKWIDAHGKEFGIGRPYLDRDPPHVGPIDGQEYVSRRGRANTQLAGSKTNRRQRLAVYDGHSMTNRATAATAPTAASTQSMSSTHSKTAGPRTSVNGPRPSPSVSRPKTASERIALNSPRPSVSVSRPKTAGERTTLNGPRPSPAVTRPKTAGERAALNSPRPSPAVTRPKTAGERPFLSGAGPT